MTSRYQFVLIDGNHGRAGSRAVTSILRKTLLRRLRDLGLNPKREAKFIETPELKKIDPASPVAAVYFGSARKNLNVTRFVEDLCAKGIFVLPVVDDLQKVKKHLPPVLTSINVQRHEKKDKAFEFIASRLLEELRLLRSRRSIFISYKRSESRTAALQLYHRLDERTFDVFLDTHSVERGVAFQPMLWDSLGDADLAILLDSPNALTSTWVEQELSRANALGLGVLQVIWPNHVRHPGTHFCEAVYLGDKDFVGGKASDQASLNPEKLEEIILKAESLRARSMAARRTRVIGELVRASSHFGVAALSHFMGPIVVKHPKKGKITVLPVVGHPDSRLIHEIFEEHKKRRGALRKNGILIYDPLGMWEKKRGHLFWLNSYLPLRALSVPEISKWLK